MRILSVLATVFLAASVAAQSPLSLPFASNNGLSANSGVFFDLSVTDPAGITITTLDVNSSSAPGTAGTVAVYTTPGTHIGVETVPSAWTLRDSGGVVSAGTNQASPVCLANGGFYLPTGSHGVCIRHVGVAIRYTNSTGLVTVATAEVAFTGGRSATMAIPFSTAPISNRVFNGNLYYNVGNVPGVSCPFATKLVFGNGCYGGADSWYESFAQMTAFDLVGAIGNEFVLIATPAGAAGYSMTMGAPAWHAPGGSQLLSNTTPAVTLSDDTMSGPQTLPFAFPFPGNPGGVTVIHACVNGFLHLGPTVALTGDFTPTVGELHDLQPRLFPLWADLDASANLPSNPGSGLYYDVDPGNQVVYFTWWDVADRRGGVPAAGATSVNFQVAIRSSGVVEYRYRSVIPALAGNGAVMTGFSKGNLDVPGGPGSVDLGPRDITAAIPFTTTGPDRVPLRLDSNAPRLGMTWTLATTGVPSVSPVAIAFFGAAAVLPGIDLGVLGAPGCAANITGLVGDVTAPAAAGASSVAMPIPNSPPLIGLSLTVQSVCFSTQNALGLQTSNGLEGRLGL